MDGWMVRSNCADTHSVNKLNWAAQLHPSPSLQLAACWTASSPTCRTQSCAGRKVLPLASRRGRPHSCATSSPDGTCAASPCSCASVFLPTSAPSGSARQRAEACVRSFAAETGSAKKAAPTNQEEPHLTAQLGGAPAQRAHSGSCQQLGWRCQCTPTSASAALTSATGCSCGACSGAAAACLSPAAADACSGRREFGLRGLPRRGPGAAPVGAAGAAGPSAAWSGLEASSLLLLPLPAPEAGASESDPLPLLVLVLHLPGSADGPCRAGRLKRATTSFQTLPMLASTPPEGDGTCAAAGDCAAAASAAGG